MQIIYEDKYKEKKVIITKDFQSRWIIKKTNKRNFFYKKKINAKKGYNKLKNVVIKKERYMNFGFKI